MINLVGSLENLKHAFLKASRGKRESVSCRSFSLRLEYNLDGLSRKLLAGTWEPGAFRTFYITDPKKRLICAAPFSDRVVHHALMNVLEPLFEARQIPHSYACRRGKRTRAALLRAFHCCKRYGRACKLDIRKYFDSIDHSVLAAQLDDLVADPRVLRTLQKIVASYATAPGKGVPIGNLTSQFFANHYLAAVDAELSAFLSPGAYIRYMDDVLLFHDDRRRLTEARELYTSRCAEALHLEVKPPLVQKTESPIPFLGMTLRKSGIFLSSRNRSRFRRKLTDLGRLLAGGAITETEFAERLLALRASRTLARSRRFLYDLERRAVPVTE